MTRIGKIISISCLSLLFFNGVTPPIQDGKLRVLNTTAFKRGETIKYGVRYGIFDAGEVIITVTDENKLIVGRNTYHIVGTGTSKGTVDFFFRVRDKYESYIDEQALAPWVFIRSIQEGGFKASQNYIYNQFRNTVDAEGKQYTVADYSQDMISAFYYARCINYSNAKEGDIFTIPAFVDREMFLLKIKYIGKETIKTDFGKVPCIKFRPVLQKGRIFKNEEDLNVWISDDLNRIPVRVEAKILVGSIKMELTDFSNLANASVIKKNN
jgi:hypothetical protein